jgi:hypothetical protein
MIAEFYCAAFWLATPDFHVQGYVTARGDINVMAQRMGGVKKVFG